LFDYESRNISKKNIRTGQAGNVLRVNEEIEFYSEDKPFPAVDA
jgi:hypothetical protein